ncbi:hypothetical protein BDV25DRAFT_136247 [Aspergillus avenaceus]|uniref:Rhodopsin domain-containing protein n=1 Tax=Aspergillus avenaceus TaxID=36643 RepID=A0A5N6U7M5_ASPAV|nr:hypothetical protein BDV25DRAFT_136247 [Aspergillus avenaceus]
MKSFQIPIDRVPEYIGDRLLIFTGLFVPLQICCVALRFYIRYKIRTPWGLDDAVILIALAAQLGMAGLSIGAVKTAGVGHHVPYLMWKNPTVLRVWAKYLLAVSFLYMGSVNVPKFSILLLYHRLFPTRIMKSLTVFMMGVLGTITVSTIIATALICRPFSANWDGKIPGYCGKKKQLYIWASFPNIVTDIILICLPMPVLWSLNMNRRLKWALTFTFAVGGMGLITSAIRFQIFFRQNAFIDGTFVAVDLITWTQVETGVYLISACLPTYRPLIEKVGTKGLLSKLSRSMSRKGGNSVQTTDSIPLHGYTARSQRFRRNDDVYTGYPARKCEVTVTYDISERVEPHTSL